MGGEGCSNGVFVVVGATHKAFARAAQLSYRYQTQRISREECACVKGLRKVSACPACRSVQPVMTFLNHFNFVSLPQFSALTGGTVV